MYDIYLKSSYLSVHKLKLFVLDFWFIKGQSHHKSFDIYIFTWYDIYDIGNEE